MGLRVAVKLAFVMVGLVCVSVVSATLAQSTQIGGSEKSMQVSQSERADAIAALLRNVESDYILPDVAKKMVQSIREHQARHDYDSINDGEQFAKALTTDLQAVSHDHHLGVDYSSDPVPEGRMDQPSPEDIRKFYLAGERRNFEYRKVECLAGGIGLLEIDGFYPDDYVRDTLAGAAGFLLHTEAVILDFRRNHGGMDLLQLESYFFKEPTHIAD